MRIAPVVVISIEERTQLEAWASGRLVAVRLAERAKMILLATQGKTDLEISDATLTVSRTFLTA